MKSIFELRIFQVFKLQQKVLGCKHPPSAEEGWVGEELCHHLLSHASPCYAGLFGCKALLLFKCQYARRPVCSISPGTIGLRSASVPCRKLFEMLRIYVCTSGLWA